MTALIVTCASCSKSNRLPAARLLDRAKCAACKGVLLPLDHPIALETTEEFDELVRDAPVPVLVDFWATWCGPCRTVAPELEKVAASRAGKIVVAKLDTDGLPDVSARFGIRSIPTMILFRGGAEANRLSGAMPSSAITSRLGV